MNNKMRIEMIYKIKLSKPFLTIAENLLKLLVFSIIFLFITRIWVELEIIFNEIQVSSSSDTLMALWLSYLLFKRYFEVKVGWKED